MLGAVREGSKRTEEASLTFPFFPHRNLVLVLGGGGKGKELKCLESTPWLYHLQQLSAKGQCDPAAHPYAKGTHEGP